ncbi:MAG: TIGR04283 family arsenosugar biosynthesis glycosyltransferase [Magnetococcales bacterium]|nr:TIGR04283 family arsenosugar biosynthesis glycosyltransferase [Magnetococcales bacterium]
MPPPRIDLSVIIPTRNENHHLPALLEQLRQQRGVTLEILVADGGSQDGTLATARAAGTRLVHAPTGRGAQMNAAARIATGEDLLFLHADSGLADPDLLHGALQAMRQARSRHGVRCAGHFPLRFVDRPPGHERIFRFFETKSALNRPGCCNGDQGLWLAGAYFLELGGFAEDLPFLEDQRLAPRIAATGHWLTLPGTLATSARRFRQEGVMERSLLNALILTALRADLLEFPRRAPAIYRDQERTGPLRLTPFFRLFRQLCQEGGNRATLRRWHAIGGFARQSFWQVMLPLDLLEWHDRMATRLDRCAGCFDLFWMGLSWLGFHLTWLWLVWRENRQKH